VKKSQIASTVESTISYADMASKIATNLLGELKLEEQRAVFRDSTNTLVQQMFLAGVRVGSRAGKNPNAVACAFHDTLTNNGISSKTASNYLSTFKAHVEAGTKINDWNLQRQKQKEDSKGGKGKGTATLVELFLKAFNHDSGKSFQVLAQEIETRFQNDEGSIYDLFVSYLEGEGYEITK
jgi:hypothetical protein